MVIGKLAVMRERLSSGAVYAWVILTVVLLASVAGSVNQFKPPLVIAGTMLIPFHVTGWTLYAFVILLGVISGATPTATFAAPEVMGNPHLSGIGMAVVSLGMNLG